MDLTKTVPYHFDYSKISTFMQVLYGCKLHLEQDKTVYEIKKLQNSINNSIITKDFGKEDLTVAHTAEKKLIAQNKKAFHDYFVDERY